MPFDTLSKAFVEQITTCGQVLVVASPFYDPLVIKRMWCLFEAVIAKLHGVPITVVSPPTEETELRDRIFTRRAGGNTLIEVMMTIDSSRAEATVAEDLHNIKKLIESEVEGGYVAVDAIYKTMIREWVLSLLDTLLAGFKARSAEAAAFADKCGLIMHGVAEYTKAIEYFERGLAIELELYGDKHPNVTSSYNNIGEIYRQQGEYAKAIEYHEKALAIRLETLGPKHPNVAISYSNLGLTHDLQGEYTKAIDYYEKALAIDLEAHGPKHPTTATRYNNIGSVYAEQGEFTKAIEYYEKALTIRLEAHDHNHPNVAQSYNNLGAAYDDRGEHTKAIECYEKALAIRVGVFGSEHPLTQITARNLAVHYNTKKDS